MRIVCIPKKKEKENERSFIADVVFDVGGSTWVHLPLLILLWVWCDRRDRTESTYTITSDSVYAFCLCFWCPCVISFHLIAHRRFPTFSPTTSQARNGPKLPRRFRHATPLPLDFPNAIVMMCTPSTHTIWRSFSYTILLFLPIFFFFSHLFPFFFLLTFISRLSILSS